VLYCVLKLCTVISTLRWAVLKSSVDWVLSHWVHFTVQRFICVYLCVFCFILHSCRITVSTVWWTWWNWSLILRTCLPSVLWHCWLGYLTCKNPVTNMTYNVFGGTLNLAPSIYLSWSGLLHNFHWSIDLTILRTYLPSVLWHCCLGYLTRKNPVINMTYNVFGGTLSLALSICFPILIQGPIFKKS